MNDLLVTAASIVSSEELASARMGPRFGRLDLCSQLAVLAVERLALDFDSFSRDRVGICLSAYGGSLATDVEYWKGRDAVGGPSPTLFAYTLPSSAVGEIAIRHRLTGPNLCIFGTSESLLTEAGHLIRTGEAGGCLCVSCRVVTPEVAELLRVPPIAQACALFVGGESLSPSARGLRLSHLEENARDIETVCALLSARNSSP